MSEAVLILKNMRGGCATVGSTVHTLFRFEGHRVAPKADAEAKQPVATSVLVGGAQPAHGELDVA